MSSIIYQKLSLCAEEELRLIYQLEQNKIGYQRQFISSLLSETNEGLMNLRLQHRSWEFIGLNNGGSLFVVNMRKHIPRIMDKQGIKLPKAAFSFGKRHADLIITAGIQWEMKQLGLTLEEIINGDMPSLCIPESDDYDEIFSAYVAIGPWEYLMKVEKSDNAPLVN